jgi:hypothetical protein
MSQFENGKMRTGRCGKMRGLSLSLAVIAALASSSAEAKNFGARCQKDYEDGWLGSLPWAYDRCDMFTAQMKKTDQSQFQYTLKWGATGFTVDDGSAGQGGVDSVDLFWVNTHGGVGSVVDKNNNVVGFNARLALYNKNTRARSDEWRFGDNGHQARILSQYACKTLTIDDKAFDRWDQVFKGGLQLATGSHGTLWDAPSTDEVGETYAANLQAGISVKWSWFDGIQDWYFDQDVAIYASSSGPTAECLDRQNNLTWKNIANKPRFRDGQMRRICGQGITDY